MKSRLSGRRIVAIGSTVVAGAMLAWLALEHPRPDRDPALGEDPPGASRGWLRGEDGRLPNVVLVTVDTLRADHVYGVAPSSWRLTPSLERLASRGTLFLGTRAPAPATRPALAALLTGSYVHRHGVASNFGSVPEQIPVLASILRRRGYVTAGFYGNKILDSKSGLDRGFAVYRSFVDKSRISRDQDGVDLALAWIASAPRQPWFLWLHLMSPHGPYNSSPRVEVAADTPDPLPDVELRPITSNYGLGPVIPKYQILNVPPRAADYRRRYRDEVFFIDAQIGRLLEGLETFGHGALVVFTADHGESLGENEYFFQHGWLANEASLQVPMIWSKPGRIAERNRVTATTSLVDVMPTLLAGLDIKAPPLDGRDLAPALRGEQIPDDVVFALTAYPNQLTTATRGRWKLVHTPEPPDPLPTDHWHSLYPRTESFVLHDLETDPRETRDASVDHPQLLAELRDRLRAWEKKNGLPSGPRGMARVDAESLEGLRALGYVD